MNTIACDSSALISLAETCNIDALSFLKEKTGTSFIIPPSVKDEIISNPMRVRKYVFSAMRLRKVLNDGVLRVVSSPSLIADSRKILEEANKLFSSGNKNLPILQEGEAQCLALFSSAKIAGLLVDEKTTRLLIEKPEKLRDVMQAEYRQKVEMNETALASLRKRFSNIAVIRSAELLAVGAKYGFFQNYKSDANDAFHASLFALRSSGCSISTGELDEYSGINI